MTNKNILTNADRYTLIAYIIYIEEKIDEGNCWNDIDDLYTFEQWLDKQDGGKD